MSTTMIDPERCRQLGIDPQDTVVALPDGFQQWGREQREAWAEAEIIESSARFWAGIYGVGVGDVRAALGPAFTAFVRRQIRALRREGAGCE